MIITRDIIEDTLTEYILHSPDNIISPEMAYDSADIGHRMYDAPILGFGSADDPLWDTMKEPRAVGSLYRTPKEWLPGARTVVTFFAPYSEAVVSSNRLDPRRIGSGWLAAYRYGEPFLKNGSHLLEKLLRDAGFDAFEPYASDRFISVYEAGSDPRADPGLSFTSNWSVRHAAFICGLGTFGLSKGLITRKGVAGRFGTVITTAGLPADARDYRGLYEYCSMCGRCAQNCPAGAISKESGKDHSKCLHWLETVEKEFPLCDCCGKCQVRVPCERTAPGHSCGFPSQSR